MKIFNKIFKNVSLTIFCVALFFTYFAPIQLSYASNDCDNDQACGIGRIRTCDGSGDPQTLQYNPTQTGADIMFDLSNPVCTAVVATSYASVKAAIVLMCKACGLNQYPNVTPSPVGDTYLIALGGVKAASSGDYSCIAATAAAAASLTSALSALSSIYSAAKIAFDNTTLCGSDWYGPDPANYSISSPKIKAEREQWIQETPSATLDNRNYREWYYNGIEYEDNPNSGDACLDPTGSNVKPYPKQKYYLRGTRPGNYNCSKYDITLSNQNIPPDKIKDYQTAFNCCKKRSQRYACIQYKNNTLNTTTSDLTAQNYGTDNDGVFCESGDPLCNIKGVTFSVAPIETSDSRMLCVQSYSLCPYNFTIGQGGSKYCDYYEDGIYRNGRYVYITPDDIAKATDATNPTNDCNTKSEIRNGDCTYNAKAGQCKNYCQYLTHCTVVGSSTYQYTSGLGSPYFSNACYNFVGDSRNLTSFNSGILMGSQRHFGAPIAQCVKETLENVFYNRAGHSQCATVDEYPLADGTCLSGNYLHDGNFTYKKGNYVKDVSFFGTLQNTLQSTVKMILSIAIMFYGLKLLVAHNMSEIKKSDIIMFCIKIGLVMYFATGDAWQTMFFDGVYNSSMTFSKIVFHIESTMPDSKKDGCQFDPASLGTANPYPAGKDYLSIWDTLDCKTARYLGFAPSASIANIAALIFAGLFTGPVGVYFVVALMFFGFFLVALTVRALHIFLSSAAAIIIMVYISPIIIPTVMFPKTADIFKKWLTNLISFCLQPMILFAYIAVFITVFDSTMIGSATFSGSPPAKAISCKKTCQDSTGATIVGDTTCSQAGHAMVGWQCKDTNGNVVIDNDPTCTLAGHYKDGGVCRDASGNDVGGDPDCSQPGHNIVDPLTDSIACLVNIDSYRKVNFLETVGISVPALYDLFTTNVKQKILTIVKAAFMMFVLYEFMDQIPSITEQLIGGTALPKGQFSSALSMMKGVAGTADGIRDRIHGGAQKYGRDTMSMMKEAREKAGVSDKDSKASDAPSSGEGSSNARTGSTAGSGGAAAGSTNQEGGNAAAGSSDGGGKAEAGSTTGSGGGASSTSDGDGGGKS